MILISHRGNVSGRVVEMENNPAYIESAIELGYDVEVDAWLLDIGFFLGHDLPEHEVSYDWFFIWGERLWIHCKNVDCLSSLAPQPELNCFWHETDTVTLTSKKYIWAFPGNQPIYGSIAVLPERNNDDISLCTGVCSDVIANYK